MKVTIIVVILIIVLGIVPFMGIPGALVNMVADLLLSKVYKVQSVLKVADSTWGMALMTTIMWPPILLLSKWLCIKYNVTLTDYRFFVFWLIIPYAWGVILTDMFASNDVKSIQFQEKLVYKENIVKITSLNISNLAFLHYGKTKDEDGRPNIDIRLDYDQDAYGNIEECYFEEKDTIEDNILTKYITIDSAKISFRVDSTTNNKIPMDLNKTELLRMGKRMNPGDKFKIKIKTGIGDEIECTYTYSQNSIVTSFKNNSKSFTLPKLIPPFENSLVFFSFESKEVLMTTDSANKKTADIVTLLHEIAQSSSYKGMRESGYPYYGYDMHGYIDRIKETSADFIRQGNYLTVTYSEDLATIGLSVSQNYYKNLKSILKGPTHDENFNIYTCMLFSDMDDESILSNVEKRKLRLMELFKTLHIHIYRLNSSEERVIKVF